MAAPDPAVRGGSSRRDPRLLLWAAALLLAGRVATTVWADRHPQAEADLVTWHPIAGAEADARKARKPVLYDFTAAWCGPCGMLRREVFADPASAARISAAFIPVRVTDRRQEDGRNPPDVAALQKRFHIEAFPTLIVVPAGGGPPLTRRGYGGKAGTMAWLDSAVPPARAPSKRSR